MFNGVPCVRDLIFRELGSSGFPFPKGVRMSSGPPDK
jgi:hypothetical protein